MMLRVDAYVAASGHATRREAKRLVRKGKVSVNGEVVRDAAELIERSATVICSGTTLTLPPAELHLLLHKPTGVACSRDQREAPLVYDLLPPDWRGVVEPAGRLDRMTTGLLVLSSDGGLIHRLISPKRKLAKRYRIGYRGTIADDAVQQCADGMALPDETKPLRPAALTLHQTAVDGLAQATLEIHEGRYHQVRRMIAHLGGEVSTLHRDRIGALDLPPDLEPGHWCEVEAELIRSACSPDSTGETE